LSRLPRLRGSVCGALPQPGSRGPRHDVRLGNHALGRRRTRRIEMSLTSLASPEAHAPAYRTSSPLPLSWVTVAVAAVVIAYGDGFIVAALHGAVGSVDTSQEPFVRWLRDSTLMVAPLVLA